MCQSISRRGAALDLEHDAAARPVASPALTLGVEDPALVAHGLESVGFVQGDVLEKVGKERLGHGLDGRKLRGGGESLQYFIQQLGDQIGRIGVPAVVGMDLIGLDLLPLHAPGLDFRPESVAEAEHRQVIVPADLSVPLLGVAAVAGHHEEQDDRGMAGAPENLSDEALQRFRGCLVVGVVDTVFDDDKIGLATEKVSLGSQAAVVGTGRPDPRVNQLDLGLGESLTPPLGNHAAVSLLPAAGPSALSDGPSDYRHGDRLTRAGLVKEAFHASRITLAHHGSGGNSLAIGGRGRKIASEGNNDDEGSDEARCDHGRREPTERGGSEVHTKRPHYLRSPGRTPLLWPISPRRRPLGLSCHRTAEA